MIAVVTGVPVSWTVLVLGAAMIVYTVRGGVAAVIWTDVVQMFVYVGGAAVVFRRPRGARARGLDGALSRRRRRPGSSPCSTSPSIRGPCTRSGPASSAASP